jgi:hypothetical protein
MELSVMPCHEEADVHTSFISYHVSHEISAWWDERMNPRCWQYHPAEVETHCPSKNYEGLRARDVAKTTMFFPLLKWFMILQVHPDWLLLSGKE